MGRIELGQVGQHLYHGGAVRVCVDVLAQCLGRHLRIVRPRDRVDSLFHVAKLGLHADEQDLERGQRAIALWPGGGALISGDEPVKLRNNEADLHPIGVLWMSLDLAPHPLRILLHELLRPRTYDDLEVDPLQVDQVGCEPALDKAGGKGLHVVSGFFGVDGLDSQSAPAGLIVRLVESCTRTPLGCVERVKLALELGRTQHRPCRCRRVRGEQENDGQHHGFRPIRKFRTHTFVPVKRQRGSRDTTSIGVADFVRVFRVCKLFVICSSPCPLKRKGKCGEGIDSHPKQPSRGPRRVART